MAELWALASGNPQAHQTTLTQAYNNNNNSNSSGSGAGGGIKLLYLTPERLSLSGNIQNLLR